MAENPYPIPRQLRQSGILVGDGGDTYGPFDFKIFDPTDVVVFVWPLGEKRFTEAAGVAVTKVNGNTALNALDSFTIKFPYLVSSTTRFVVLSSRLAARSAGVMAGTRISPDALEKELSKMATQQQELRRDLSRAWSSEFGQPRMTLDEGVEDGDTFMKQGDRIVRGPKAQDIAEAQGYASDARESKEAAEASAILAQQAEEHAVEVTVVLQAEVAAAIDEMESKLEGAAEGLVSAATWSQLALTSATRIGQPGRVPTTDTGVHVDPITGESVPNGGDYRWSGTAWQRTGDVIDPKGLATQINSMVVTSVDTAMLEPSDDLIPGFGFAIYMEDTGVVSFGIRHDGTFVAYAQADIVYAVDDEALFSEYVHAITDAVGKVAVGVRRDGSIDAALNISDSILSAIEVSRLSRAEGKVGVKGDLFARAQVTVGLDRVMSTVGGVARPYLQRKDIASPTYLFDTDAKIAMLMAGGQSLSVGGLIGAGSVVNATAPAPQNALMFNTGVVGVQSNVLDPATLIDFLSAREVAGSGFGETQGSAMASWLYRKGRLLDEASRAYLYRSHGSSGKLISELNKAGGQPPFFNAVKEAQKAVSIASAYGKQIWVPSVMWTHGEGDRSVGTSFTAYRAALIQLLADYNSDIRAVLPADNGPISMIMDQLSAGADGASAGSPALAQLDAARNAAGFYISTPKYIFRMNVADVVHLNALSYAVLGEYQAKAWRRINIEGEAWKPLWPVSLVRNNAQVVINFNVPRGSLAWDFDLLPPAKNFGFEYVDDSNSATISSVSITGPSQVTITLSGVPTGSNKKVRYAFTALNLGGGTRSGAWGNLRDYDPEPSFQEKGRLLHNFCVAFEEAIS